MAEIHTDRTLQEMFDGATQFGLTHDEVWRTVSDSTYVVGYDATVRELVDELSAELARRILAKQRRQHAAPDRPPQPASEESRSRLRKPF